jgi:hypothetical protein
MRITISALVIIVLSAAYVWAGVGAGTIETSLGGNVHLSPEPWEINANMYLVYYLNPMFAIGPFWEVQKYGDIEVCEDMCVQTGPDEWEPRTVEGTFKSSWHYRIGLFGKFYLPIALAGGKLMPYVAAGGGIVSLPKPVSAWDDVFKEETETKFGYFGELSFDYWVTDSWTFWAGVRGFKVSGDEETYYDMLDRDVTEFQTQILFGISHFLMTD